MGSRCFQSPHTLSLAATTIRKVQETLDSLASVDIKLLPTCTRMELHPFRSNFNNYHASNIIADGSAYTFSLESFRSVFTVNVNLINYHVALSYGNVRDELLTICMAGTTLHCKHILMSYFAVQKIPFNVL